MAAEKHPAQHNDSVTATAKRADQGPVLRERRTPGKKAEQGRGHDERGQYGKSAADPESEDQYSAKPNVT